MSRKPRALPPSPFHRFKASPEVIRLAVMVYVRFPLSLPNVENLLAEQGIDICHETVRFWRMASLQKFVSVHANVHNHFNRERHPVDRQTCKARRSAALAG